MRNLKRNTRRMWYALFEAKNSVLDENGDKTGDYTIRYSSPVSFYASISAGKGSAEKEMFGVDIDFTRSISTVDLNLPITETSLIWVETPPSLLNDGSADPSTADYEVAARPVVGQNVIVIALEARAKND